MLNLFKKKSIMKSCCNCCCFKDQIETHRNQTEKELKDLLTQWMKNHPEVERVFIGNKNIFTSGVTLHQKSEMYITIYFDKY